MNLSQRHSTRRICTENELIVTTRIISNNVLHRYLYCVTPVIDHCYFRRTCTENDFVTTALDQPSYHFRCNKPGITTRFGRAEYGYAGGFIKHKPYPGQRNPPASASLWRCQGGFLCPWPYNDGDRVDANYPQGGVTYE